MTDYDSSVAAAPFSLRKAFGLYALFLLLICLLMTVISKTTWFPGIIGVVAYLAFGFMLNRLVLRRLGWHPLYNTLYNVSREKLSAFLFWPLWYPVLFFRLFVNKVL